MRLSVLFHKKRDANATPGQKCLYKEAIGEREI